LQATIADTNLSKIVLSESYNFAFDKTTGQFARWGKTLEDDPEFGPFGPELLDLEISEGECSGNCKFCYKSNGVGKSTYNMTFDNFKTIFDKIPKVLTQIAFGICDITTNPDFFTMMRYSKDNGVIPNYTCNGNGVSEDIAIQTLDTCGAVAVSVVDHSKSFKAIKRFIQAGMTQVNIHYMLSLETLPSAFKLVDNIASDPDLKGLNAIVFLQYKAKGNNVGSYSYINDIELYKQLITHCQERKVNYGFDSCSAPTWFKTLPEENKAQMSQFGEPCESGLFSSYINCHGVFFPCSFTEGEVDWKEGLDVLSCSEFMKDIWYHERLVEWRTNLINSCAHCECEFKPI